MQAKAAYLELIQESDLSVKCEMLLKTVAGLPRFLCPRVNSRCSGKLLRVLQNLHCQSCKVHALLVVLSPIP